MPLFHYFGLVGCYKKVTEFWKFLPMNAVFREAFLLHSWNKSFMPAFLHLQFMAYSQSPHQWKRQRKQIRKWTVFCLKLEALFFQVPQTFVASSVLGWMKNKSVGQRSLSQWFCSICYLRGFFLRHGSHPTFNSSLIVIIIITFGWILKFCQILTLSHLISISNHELGSDES